MKIKKNYIYIGVIAVVVLLAAIAFYMLPLKKQPEKPVEKQEKEWNVDDNGYLSYPLDRGNVLFRREDYGIDGNLTIHKIIYQSRNGNIYGLLVLPTTAEELLPGIVLLPGAGVSKESELSLAKKIALLDAAVLVIDQRGVGETDGNMPSLAEDLEIFRQGQEPYRHLMIYDVLRAYDLLESAPFVDSERVIIAGESLGGMNAIIAAAIDRNIAGVLAISAAGFGFNGTGDKHKDAFGKSIDADHYIGLIAPRKIVMIHNYKDSGIPLANAVRTYQKAQQPKQFVLVNDTACNHGYCDSMYDGLVEALDYLADIRSRTLVSVPDGTK